MNKILPLSLLALSLASCLNVFSQPDNSLGVLWKPMGPAPENQDNIGIKGGVSGRVWTIAFSSNFDQKGTPAMFIGIGGGGIWRSSDFLNATPIWTPLLDHLPTSFPLARQVGLTDIGAIAVDPNHPWVIYAGSGDLAGVAGNAYGQGLLKSSDGGATWTLLNLGNSNFAPGFTRIFVDPSDPSGNTVYATGNFGPSSPARGIFKSTNAGANWNNIQSGMPTDVGILDLDYTWTGNKITLYAGVNDYSGSNGAINGIWQSVNGGNSWTQMTINPLVDLTGHAVATSNISNIRIATNHLNHAPNGIFVAVGNSANAGLANIFKLSGQQWVPGSTGISGITSIYGALAFGMSETGILYAGMGNTNQDGIFQSTDGGEHWTNVLTGTDGTRPHHDQRCWGFASGQVFEGNDGGINRFVARSNGKAGPGVWQSLNTPSLQTILANGVGIHPEYPNVLLVGSQDNSVALRKDGTWKYVTGDDDGRCSIDPFDANYMYRTGVSDYHFFFRSDDGGNTWKDKSVTGKPNVPWYADFVFHPNQPARIVVGLDRIYETRNRGDAWTPISDQLGGNGVDANALCYGLGDTLYVSFGGHLFKTTDDGTAWTELDKGNNWNGSIVAIGVDRMNSSDVYVATDGGAIWHSPDAGSGWTNISGDFPGSPLAITALAIRDDPAFHLTTLYISTSVGVYFSSGTGRVVHWARFGDQLPDVGINDLKYNPTNKNLFAAAYGRGVFGAYTHFLTLAPPSATTLGNVVFNAALDENGTPSLNQAQYGDAFSGWFKIQGIGLFNTAPAITSIRNSIFVFETGRDGHIYLNQAQYGYPFTGWFEVQGNGLSNNPPAAASLGNTVYLFVRGTDGNIYKNEADFGHPFGNWFVIPGGLKTNQPPAVVTHGNTIYVIATGMDGKIYKNEADVGHSFSGWFEIQGNGQSDVGPAAAVIQNTLYVVIKGTDGKVYKNEADFGHAFGNWFELQGGGITDVAPSATAVSNSLFVFMKGLDDRVYLNQAAYRQAFSGWFEVGGGIQ